MAKLEEQYPLDYRNGGDTIDDFAQKYMKQINAIFQFLNNLRELNSKGPIQVEPQPYQFKAEDSKLYMRNEENDRWLYLFDIKYRMGMADNAEAKIITSDDVTDSAEPRKIVKTNEQGRIDADITGNAHTASELEVPRNITIADSSANNKGPAILFSGNKDIVIKLPENIGGIFNGDFYGNFNGKFTGKFAGEAANYVSKDDVLDPPRHDLADTPGKIVAINDEGLLPVSILGNAGKLAGVTVAIQAPEDGQVITYREASKTWTNESRPAIGEAKALSFFAGDKLLFEYAGGKTTKFDINTVLSDNFFDIDASGGIMPAEKPAQSSRFELDEQGDIMLRAYDEIPERFEVDTDGSIMPTF